MTAQMQAMQVVLGTQSVSTVELTREVKARRMSRVLELAADVEKLANAAAHKSDSELLAQLRKTAAELHSALANLGSKKS